MPCKQYKLIHKDGLRISQYIARTLDGAAMHSHMRKDNYFYFNCCTGRFARDSCPSYLKQDRFDQLKAGDIDKLEIMNGSSCKRSCPGSSPRYSCIALHSSLQHCFPANAAHALSHIIYVKEVAQHGTEFCF